MQNENCKVQNSDYEPRGAYAFRILIFAVFILHFALLLEEALV